MKIRVLIVEDDAHQAELMSSAVGAMGLDVVVTADVDSALDSVKRRKPDLVITDLDLPGASGYDLCDRLRADAATKGTPILMVTGALDRFKRAGRLPPDGYLAKPYALGQLFEVVGKLSGALPPGL